MPTPGTGRGHQRIKGDTHRSTFGTGESHHTSLASGSRGTGGTRASILTSGTLLGGGKAPLEGPMTSQGGRRRRRRGHQQGQLTGGPVLPSGPGLPGLPVRPCEEKEEHEELRGFLGMLQRTGASWDVGQRAGQPCHRVTVSPAHLGTGESGFSGASGFTRRSFGAHGAWGATLAGGTLGKGGQR